MLVIETNVRIHQPARFFTQARWNDSLRAVIPHGSFCQPNSSMPYSFPPVRLAESVYRLRVSSRKSLTIESSAARPSLVFALQVLPLSESVR